MKGATTSHLSWGLYLLELACDGRSRQKGSDISKKNKEKREKKRRPWHISYLYRFHIAVAILPSPARGKGKKERGGEKGWGAAASARDALL